MKVICIICKKLLKEFEDVKSPDSHGVCYFHYLEDREKGDVITDEDRHDLTKLRLLDVTREKLYRHQATCNVCDVHKTADACKTGQSLQWAFDYVQKKASQEQFQQKYGFR